MASCGVSVSVSLFPLFQNSKLLLYDKTTSTPGCMNPCTTTPITPSTATTRLAVTLALLQQRRVPRLLISRSQRLYFSYAVRRDYSSSRLHRLYYAYAVHPDAPSRRSTSRRLVALALAVRSVTASRGVTTRRPDCTGSTVPMPCIRTCRLAARLVVGRSRWLSSCVRSLRLAARLLVVWVAPALLRLCRASGRAVSTLHFSSVGRTGSRRVPGHSVVRRDYPSRGRNGYTSTTLRGSSRGSSRRSSSTTPTTPRVRVPRHVARLVTRLVAPLVINYFAYAARPGASARHTARR
jgi:hypothetical protein